MQPVKRAEFYDCKDDLKVMAAYEDIGVGPAVVFDGAGFTSALQLNAFIDDLTEMAGWLELQGSGSSPRQELTKETE